MSELKFKEHVQMVAIFQVLCVFVRLFLDLFEVAMILDVIHVCFIRVTFPIISS